MVVSNMGVASGGPVPEQLSDQWQVLVGHHGLTGGGVAQVEQAQLAELGIRAGTGQGSRRCESHAAARDGARCNAL